MPTEEDIIRYNIQKLYTRGRDTQPLFGLDASVFTGQPDAVWIAYGTQSGVITSDPKWKQKEGLSKLLVSLDKTGYHLQPWNNPRNEVNRMTPSGTVKIEIFGTEQGDKVLEEALDQYNAEVNGVPTGEDISAVKCRAAEKV